MRFLLLVACSLLCYAQPIRYADLHYPDVTSKSSEMLQHHATFHSLDDELIGRLLDRFLFELDPMKCFFLQSEIEQWQKPSRSMISEIRRECILGEFPQFEKMFDLREQVAQRNKSLDLMAKQLPLTEQPDAESIIHGTWLSSSAELIVRLRLLQSLEEKAIARVPQEEQNKVRERLCKRKRLFVHQNIYATQEEKEKRISTLILKAFAAALDSHTTYFTPSEIKLFVSDVQQRIFGVGVLFRDDIDGFTVLEIVKGGPAHKQGVLKIQDKVISVDHESIVGDDLIDVVDRIRGKEGTYVTLKVAREKKDSAPEIFDVLIKRGAVIAEEQRLESKILPSKAGPIGYLHATSFYQDEKTSTSEDLRKKILEMKAQHPIGIILDLRGNPGGVLQQAVDSCGLFLNSALICSVKERNSIYPFWTDGSKKVWEGPLIVLVDRTSASASEIVAQALQDWGRAIIVGDDRTFGKGSYQMLSCADDKGIHVNPKGEYKITRGCYYTTSGKSPQKVGVHPDIEVASIFRYMNVGEEFSTYPLLPESIPSFFQEPSLFSTSEPSGFLQKLKNSFSKPILQKKDDFLAIYAHILQKNSQNRLLQSKEYQAYLTDIQNKKWDRYDEKPPVDFQLQETVDVMQDLYTSSDSRIGMDRSERSRFELRETAHASAWAMEHRSKIEMLANVQPILQSEGVYTFRFKNLNLPQPTPEILIEGSSPCCSMGDGAQSKDWDVGKGKTNSSIRRCIVQRKAA